MSIERRRRDYYIYCDSCRDIIGNSFESFQQAVNWKRYNKHICQSAKSPYGDWADFCAKCVQAGHAHSFRNGH